MEKISISKVVEFRRLKDGSRLTFVNNLKKPKQPKLSKEGKPSEGGDYWTTSLSTISNVYKENDSNLIPAKIDDLLNRHDLAKARISKDMYLRNIELLHNVENFNFEIFKPEFHLNYLSKPREKSIFKINQIPVQVLPQHVFTYTENDISKIGAVWFVTKLGGYKIEEIGVFSDALYRYLNLNYSSNFVINLDFCTAFDVSSLQHVHYSMLDNKTVPMILESTINTLKPLL